MRNDIPAGEPARFRITASAGAGGRSSVHCGMAFLITLALTAPAFAQGYGESPYIFGIHETV